MDNLYEKSNYANKISDSNCIIGLGKFNLILNSYSKNNWICVIEFLNSTICKLFSIPEHFPYNIDYYSIIVRRIIYGSKRVMNLTQISEFTKKEKKNEI